MKTAVKTTKRLARKRRIRSKLIGTATRPRLTIFRSNKVIYAQLIDDTNGITIASASSIKDNTNNIAAAIKVGKSIAEAATKAKITECIFDRNGYNYHGRVKALADAAREGGLKF